MSFGWTGRPAQPGGDREHVHARACQRDRSGLRRAAGLDESAA